MIQTLKSLFSKIFLFVSIFSLALSATAQNKDFSFDAWLPGGNISVDGIRGDTLYLRPDIRDTQGDWFYWHFRCNAPGRTLTFIFVGHNKISALGPAVSTDQGKTWYWLGAAAVTKNKIFSYTFPTNSSEVRFSSVIPYLPHDLENFLSKYSTNAFLKLDTLCTTKKGRSVPKIIIRNPKKEPKYKVFITARHHACETSASYELEGIMESLLSDNRDMKFIKENVEFMIIPIVDMDGVVDGDQGKNRKPRDHNRDYDGISIYESTGAIRNQVPKWSENKLVLTLDLHGPFIRGEVSDLIHIVGSQNKNMEAEQKKFWKFLEDNMKGPLKLNHPKDFVAFGTEWNTSSNYTLGTTASTWGATLDGVKLAACLEFPYALNGKQMITVENSRFFGNDVAVAISLYLQSLK